MVDAKSGQSAVTVRANASAFRYTGRWHVDATSATTLCTGAIVEFVFAGRWCEMVFDVVGSTQAFDVMVQVDDGAIVRHRLGFTSNAVRLSAENRPLSVTHHEGYWHRVRCWAILASADPHQWTNLNGACRFVGVRCERADAPLPELPPTLTTIEFLGDSITQSLRLLYDGNDGWDNRDLKTDVVTEWRSSLDHQHPVLNWPWQLSQWLGAMPIVTGFGGQGLTHTGTIGVPPTSEAFPFAYGTTRWTPTVAPKAVVIYHGTNDAALTEDVYCRCLQQVRAAYPKAMIFAVCPHPKGNYASMIQQAAASIDDRTHFVDCSVGVIDSADTSDSCHLNPSGAMKLAVRLASAISSVWHA